MYAMILDDRLNFKWAEVPDPVRKAGEILIKTTAAAVNRADLLQKDGCYASLACGSVWLQFAAAG